MRILVADDDAVSRTMIAGVLGKWRHQVVQARGGQEALTLMLDSEAPHLAILDWMMPDIDGIDLIRAIRRAKLDFPPYILMLTGLKEREHRIAALRAGADDFLSKPLDLEEFEVHLQAAERVVRLEDRLISEARTDPLTGLLNCQGTQLALSRELDRASRSRNPLAVGMLDLDHFKQVNDTWGHPTGDDVLVELANRLRSITRSYDSIGRMGGEEFLVILPFPPEDETPWERIRSAIAATPFPTRSGPLPVTVSIGYTDTAPAESSQELLERVDKALYNAKNAGRNRVSTL